MSDESFRMVVAAGVVIASLAFFLQAVIVVAVYRLARKTQVETTSFISRVEPVIAKIGPTLDQAGPVILKIGPALEHLRVTLDRAVPVADSIAAVIARIAPVVERVGPLMDRVGPVIDRISPVMDKVGDVVVDIGGVVNQAGLFVERATRIAATTNDVISDARPKIEEISDEAISVVRTSREQIEHAGAVLRDVGDRARSRLEQLDNTVESTVEQVEQVSGAMKRAVLRPVREVNGFAAGITAAVNTLVRRPHKSSVDAATTDEEMFI